MILNLKSKTQLHMLHSNRPRIFTRTFWFWRTLGNQNRIFTLFFFSVKIKTELQRSVAMAIWPQTMPKILLEKCLWTTGCDHQIKKITLTIYKPVYFKSSTPLPFPTLPSLRWLCRQVKRNKLAAIATCLLFFHNCCHWFCIHITVNQF